MGKRSTPSTSQPAAAMTRVERLRTIADAIDRIESELAELPDRDARDEVILAILESDEKLAAEEPAA